jgi:hypothetical protein
MIQDIFIIGLTAVIVMMVIMEPYCISWKRFKRQFCRHRQMRMPTGTAVMYRGQWRTVVACRWSGATWRYQLSGCGNRWVKSYELRERK